MQILFSEEATKKWVCYFEERKVKAVPENDKWNLNRMKKEYWISTNNVDWISMSSKHGLFVSLNFFFVVWSVKNQVKQIGTLWVTTLQLLVSVGRGNIGCKSRGRSHWALTRHAGHWAHTTMGSENRRWSRWRSAFFYRTRSLARSWHGASRSCFR